MAFDIDGHVDALSQDRGGGAHRRDTGVPISAVYRNQRAYPHRFAQKRIVEQLLLRHNRSAPRNQRQHDRRIDVGHVVGHEDVSAFGIELVESDGLDPYPGEACPGPGGAHGDAVQEANVAGQESPGKAQHGRQREREAPEREHHDGANHGRVSPAWASPFSHAARRAFCCRRDFVQIVQLKLNFLPSVQRPLQLALAGRVADTQVKRLAGKQRGKMPGEAVVHISGR